jgi:hypothetical protein
MNHFTNILVYKIHMQKRLCSKRHVSGTGSSKLTRQSLRKNLSRNGQVLMAHACNSSYSGGRDQEDGGSKPA